MTTITYDNTASGGSTLVTGSFTYHPGDTNGNGTSTPDDILALIDSLNGTTPLPDERADIDRDGMQGPTDILRLIDVLNGAGEFEAWNGV